MRWPPFAACLLLFTIPASGCSKSDPVAVQQYATAHATSLVTGTRPLWTKYRVLSADIPKSEYTPEMKALKPTLVTAGKSGLSLYIKTSYANVTGIFIRYDPSFPTPDTAPPDSGDMVFRRLGDDVFWFSMPR